jgi:hypothetical protein
MTSTQTIVTTTTQTPVDLSATAYNDILPDISDIFKLKSNLRSHVKFNKAVQKIVTHIQQIPEVQKLRTNFDLVKRSMDIIENLGFKKKEKVDKKELLLTAFKIVFKLTTVEIAIISDFIEFVASNKLIKKLSFFKRNYIDAKKIFLKTLLK